MSLMFTREAVENTDVGDFTELPDVNFLAAHVDCVDTFTDG